MGIRYTRKQDDNEQQERTVPAEEFVKRMVKGTQKEQQPTELPRTEIEK